MRNYYRQKAISNKMEKLYNPPIKVVEIKKEESKVQNITKDTTKKIVVWDCCPDCKKAGRILEGHKDCFCEGLILKMQGAKVVKEGYNMITYTTAIKKITRNVRMAIYEIPEYLKKIQIPEYLKKTQIPGDNDTLYVFEARKIRGEVLRQYA